MIEARVSSTILKGIFKIYDKQVVEKIVSHILQDNTNCQREILAIHTICFVQ